MIALVDAAYQDNASAAACVTAADWDAAEAIDEVVHLAGPPADYTPGEFYLRELPLLLAVLGKLSRAPHVVVIDGYVWLDGSGRPGLGAHLFEALDGGVRAVVGVAKTRFADADRWAEAVLRGRSSRPLYVTAVGLSAGKAADCVRAMHGPARIPTLVAKADRLARAALAEGGAKRRV